jgi:hypothetical protein
VNGLPPNSGGPDIPGGATPLATDTLADKGVRFGCGALLGLLLVLGVAEFGEGLTLEGFIAVGALAVAGCGAFGVTHGERFFSGLLKVFKWL